MFTVQCSVWRDASTRDSIDVASALGRSHLGLLACYSMVQSAVDVFRRVRPLRSA
jgi:hypothetical protein